MVDFCKSCTNFSAFITILGFIFCEFCSKEVDLPSFIFDKKRKNRKQFACDFYGALAEIRTPDTLIKSQVLYRLSYKGICEFTPIHNITAIQFCQ